MKSKLIKMYDYKLTRLPNEAYVERESIRGEMDKELGRALSKYKKSVHADRIEAGDIAIIDIESEAPKYNRKRLGVNVGKNLYSREIEAALIGKAAGEEFDVEADGVGAHVCVRDATRRVTPELDDELVLQIMNDSEEEHPEISNTRQYLDWLHAKAFKTLGDDIWVEYTDNLMTEIIEKSEWSRDEEEIEDECRKYLADMEKELAKEKPGMTLETMSAEDYHMYDKEVSNLEEFRAWLRKMMWQEIQLHLIYCGLKGVEDVSRSLDDMDGDAWGLLVDYVSDKIEIKERK
ncbi:MAG: hypothetical protein NC223_01715 [Butyrivibrio sp.]|nr:hypothetical protein [Butyrivibrio sp.]